MNQQPNKRGIRKGFAEISTNLLFNSKIFLTGKGGGDGSKSIQIFRLFNDLFLLTAGSFTLIYRPISKSSGLRHRKKETIFGILFLIFGLSSFIGKLFR